MNNALLILNALNPRGGCCGVIMIGATIFAMALLFCAVPEKEESGVYSGSGVISKKEFAIDFQEIKSKGEALAFVRSNESECIKFNYPSLVKISVTRPDLETLKITVYNPGINPVNLKPIYFTIKPCAK